jgi:hypothetical protein
VSSTKPQGYRKPPKISDGRRQRLSLLDSVYCLSLSIAIATLASKLNSSSIAKESPRFIGGRFHECGSSLYQPRAAARGRNTPHSALVFGPVGVHNALNGLVDLVEDEGAG